MRLSSLLSERVKEKDELHDDIKEKTAWLGQYAFGQAFLHILEQLELQAPALYDCVDFERIIQSNIPQFIDQMTDDTVDFKTAALGGRGEFYRQAQENAEVRLTGIQTIFRLVSPEQDLSNLSADYKILDVLGGDGLLTRSLAKILPANSMPGILTSDLSSDMVYAALQYGLAAIRQPAQYLLVKENCMDSVVLAYGTHHIPLDQRLQACKEAYRALKPGGRILLHDFENRSPVAYWFREVVDRYSLTGHKFPHFHSEEMEQYLSEAGFQNVQVSFMYDPFVVRGDSPDEAKYQLSEYVRNMYGLVKLVDREGKQHNWQLLYKLICQYFHYDYEQMHIDSSFRRSRVQITKQNGLYIVEMPRMALIGTATKPFV